MTDDMKDSLTSRIATADEDLPVGVTTLGKLVEKLPHGSGIDCVWKAEVKRSDIILLKNSYHLMNDDGMYDGWLEFKIRLFKHTTDKLNELRDGVHVQILARKGEWDWEIYLGEGKRRKLAEGMLSYLYDLFYPVFNGAGLCPPLHRSCCKAELKDYLKSPLVPPIFGFRNVSVVLAPDQEFFDLSNGHSVLVEFNRAYSVDFVKAVFKDASREECVWKASNVDAQETIPDWMKPWLTFWGPGSVDKTRVAPRFIRTEREY